MAFVKAARKRVSFKMALLGPSGSGKTLSALFIAKGLAGDGKIALIDTENESAALYADRVGFDICPLEAPFTVQKYVQAIRDSVEGGYSVLVIDSLSHAWAGEGGLLAQKESIDSRGGNSFSNWQTITKQHEALKQALLQAPIHVITTMRSKQDYVIEQNGSKSAPRKVGMAPVQRDGMEYEFSTVFDIGMGHEAIVSKDRTGLFDGVVGTLTPAHGKQIREWLETGAEPTPAPVASPPAAAPAANKSRPPDDRERNAAIKAFATAAGKLHLDIVDAAQPDRPSLAKVERLFHEVCQFGNLRYNGQPLDRMQPGDWNYAAQSLADYARHVCPPDEHGAATLTASPEPSPHSAARQVAEPEAAREEESAGGSMFGSDFDDLDDPFGDDPALAAPPMQRGGKSGQQQRRPSAPSAQAQGF